MRQLLIILVMNFIATYCFANDNANLASYLTLLPKGTDISILVQSVEKKPKTILAYQNNQFRQPASVQKLITALTAQLQLGNDFQFVTRMLSDAKIENGQLKGNLIIQMSGDPTFTRNQLNEMLTSLKFKGINQINGNIIIDTSIFNGHDKASGWSWNNLTACYNTAPTPIIIDENCFYTSILPGKKVGEKAKVTVSRFYPVKITSELRTIARKSDLIQDKYCELDIVAKDKNNYHFKGCIKQDKNTSHFRFAVMDDFSYFTAILQTELKEKKIKFNGKFTESKQPLTTKQKPLAVAKSKALPELLTIMLKKSNNLIADALFRTIGANYFNMSGNWKNSSDAVKAILQTKANIDLSNAVIIDGSGLSRLNLIDANKLMLLLQYIAANDDKLHLIEKLPIAGVDGTLQYRKSFIEKPFKSIVYAKTGHLEGNYNLAGFIKQEKGDYIAFIQFISGYSYQKNGYEPKNTSIMQFEKALYEALIKP